jgi:hypothetical protein
LELGLRGSLKAILARMVSDYRAIFAIEESDSDGHG